MIVGHHFANMGVCHSILGDTYDLWFDGSFVNRIIVSFLLPGGTIGVAIFFIITGYFMINRHRISLIKVVEELAFYGLFSILIGIIAYSSGYHYEGLQPRELAEWIVKAIFTPVTGGLWWFASAYVYLVLLSPVINQFLSKLNKRGFIFFIITFGFGAYLIDNLFGGPYGGIQKGVEFYAIGAYIRRFVGRIKHSKNTYLVISAVSWGLCTGLYYFMNICLANESEIKGQIIYVALLWVLSAGPVTICSISTFLWAKSLAFKSRKINILAKTTFGIYLIHEGLFTRWWIWKGLLKVDTVQFQSVLFPLTAPISILGVFVVCSFIDYIRLKIIEPQITKGTQWLAQAASKKFLLK